MRRLVQTPLRLTIVLVAVLALAATAAWAGPTAGTSKGRSSERELKKDAEGASEALEGAEQYAEARTAPAGFVRPGALTAARRAASHLPRIGGSWSEITTKPYQNDDPNYRDPVWSNSGAGWGLVSGRVTALAVDGGAVYAGTADGGVWKSTDGGTTWQPLFDTQDTLSIGAVAVNPADHSIWVGTGEANTSSDSYAGIGVLRSADGGATWQKVGGDELLNHLIERLVFDGQGNVYAATAYGLYKRSTSDLTSPWNLVLAPCIGQHDTTYISDVAVRPGSAGQTVLAVVGWRGGSDCNGFYLSTDGGSTFNLLSLNGAINESQIGRTSLAYSADGSKLYAVVESSKLFNHPSQGDGGTNLMGVFVSPHGGAAGTWRKIAESRKLASSGSALHKSRGYMPGVQSWYNQFLAVDPANPDHVYLGLEEVFETQDGGVSWRAVGPYWNFGLKCAKQGVENCPPTTHPDQHAIAIAGDTVWIGNDGGVYSRALQNADGWDNHNAGLRTLQYYFAGVGASNGGNAYWGGLQDNGVSLLLPGADTMVSPFGGDGGDTIVDPANADRAVVEYTSLDMASTTNGGKSDGSVASFKEMTPSCFAFTYTPDPCDPNPRFIAPFRADPENLDHWVAGGEFVWDNGGKGWDTSCSKRACDWTIVHDTGAGHSITGLAVVGDTIYAAWCGPCNPPGFADGIDTNAGGTWHTVSASNLPSRFVAAVIADPSNSDHIYAVYNGYSRRWVPGGGVGHVFESTDGGDTFTDISGDLPDAPGDDLVMSNGKLVLATDIGVFIADQGQGAGTSWSRFGTGLPNSSTNDLTMTPDGSAIVAATHGRGLWQIAAP